MSIYKRLSLLVIGLFISLACNFDFQEENTALPTQESSAILVQPSEQLAVIASPIPQATPAEPQNITATLTVESYGFGQEETVLGYGFRVKNPDSNQSLANSNFDVVFYDSNDAVIITDAGYIDLVPPGGEFGVGGSLWLDSGVEISRMEVQIQEGALESNGSVDPLTLENTPLYQHDEFGGSRVTALIHNPNNANLFDFKVYAILYDSEGKIIGGGLTFSNFIQQQSSSGVDVMVTEKGVVDHCEVYPAISALSEQGDGSLKANQTLSLEKYGYGQVDDQVGYGFLLKNSEFEQITQAAYHITFFGENDSVLAVEEGSIDYVLPDIITGQGNSITLSGSMAVTRMEAQVLALGYMTESNPPVAEFATKNVEYRPDSYTIQVWGNVTNPLDKGIRDLYISAITYDADGNINGGGGSYSGLLYKNSDNRVQISVVAPGRPAQVELYARWLAISAFE